MSRNDSSDPLPFTQVDRAVKAKAAVLASAIGINYQQALGSLIEFWDLNGDPREIEKLVANDVHEVVLDGREVALRFKIASGQDVDVQVLTRTGFLEPIGDRFRVRGMSRYFKPVEKRIMRRKLGSIAGLASAESRKTKYGSAQPGVVLVDQIPTKPEPNLEPTPNQTRTKPEPNAEPKGNLEDRGQRTESLKTAPKQPARDRDSDLLKADFKEVTGHDYLWNGAKDGVALAALKKTATIEEIRARWRGGLKVPASDWASCRTIAQLRSKFNDLVSSASKPKHDPLDARVM